MHQPGHFPGPPDMADIIGEIFASASSIIEDLLDTGTGTGDGVQAEPGYGSTIYIGAKRKKKELGCCSSSSRSNEI